MRIMSQYWQIIVADESRKSLCICVDWSENGKVYQAMQEKEACYHEIRVSINSVAAYMSSNVIFHCTISDVTFHKATAVWASRKKILGSFDLDALKSVYIISVSPNSQ